MLTREGLERFYKFNFAESALTALKSAGSIAADLRHDQIGTEHILSGLIRERLSLFSELGVDPDRVGKSVWQMRNRWDITKPVVCGFTDLARQAIHSGIGTAKLHNFFGLTESYLLLGLLVNDKSLSSAVLLSFGMTSARVSAHLRSIYSHPKKG